MGREPQTSESKGYTNSRGTIERRDEVPATMSLVGKTSFDPQKPRALLYCQPAQAPRLQWPTSILTSIADAVVGSGGLHELCKQLHQLLFEQGRMFAQGYRVEALHVGFATRKIAENLD